MPKTPCLFAPADDRNALATTPAGKPKVKVDLASRFSTRSARKFIHEQSESYTCHHLPRIKTFR